MVLVWFFWRGDRVPDTFERESERRDVTEDRQASTGHLAGAGYAAVAWCVLFGGLHLYWALGGDAGFAQLSTPPNKALALARDPVYVGMAWGVVAACTLGALVALAPIQAWGRRIPRWLVLTVLWVACGISLLRGFGNLIQTALVTTGVIYFPPLAGEDAEAWRHWLRIDSIFFSPWFILGGVAFGATAWLARRSGPSD